MTIPDGEKIDRINRICDALNQREFDRVLEMAHPEVVLVPAGGQGPLRGPEAVRAWMEPDAFDSQVLEPLEFEVAGNRVLVRIHSIVRGAGSGIEIEVDAWTVYSFDDEGTVTRAEIFLSHEENEARQVLKS